MNSAYSDDTERYGAGETVSISGLEMKAVETRIYSIDEYKERFNADPLDMLEVWCVTSLAWVAFGQMPWDFIQGEEFWYVPALEPVKIMMKLKLDD